MKISKLRDLTPKVATVVDYPLHVVEDVVAFQFKELFKFLKAPAFAGFKVQNLGTFRVDNLNVLNAQIKDLIKHIRAVYNPTYKEYYKEQLRFLWHLRRSTIIDKELRVYSKRFPPPKRAPRPLASYISND